MRHIHEVFNQQMQEIHETINQTNWADRQIYAEWLAQTYFYAVHTTRIISLAGSLFPLDRHELHLRFLEHTREENNHEKILVSDLKELGYQLNQFKPNMAASCLYQTQFYYIQNISPMAVYGYFLYLEGLAVEFGPQVLARLQGHHPDRALKYLKVHAEEDQDHVKEHYDYLSQATEFELKHIEANLIQTSQLYQRLMLGLNNSVAKFKVA